MNKVLTDSQVVRLLHEKNPRRFGPNADPLVETKTDFILTGRIKKNSAGNEVIVWLDKSNLTEEDLKANPNLKPSRYLRITRTDAVPDFVPGQPFTIPRKPIAQNLFENENPLLFNTLVGLLKEKDKNGKLIHFKELENDANGNPMCKLISPVWGAFVTINWPAHKRLDANRKPLAVRRKNLMTGQYEAKATPVVFREDTFWLPSTSFDRLESIAIQRFRKFIEPLLLEEVSFKVNSAGRVTEEKIETGATETDLYEQGEGQRTDIDPDLLTV